MKHFAILQNWIDAIDGCSKGWRYKTAFALGLIAALALPPTSIFPLFFVCFPVLVLMLRAAENVRQAFWTGWWFAFGFFLLGLYWTAASMFVDIRLFWWAVPLALAGLPTICALFYGLAFAIVKKIGINGTGGPIMVALGWFAADYARGHVLTGFPWNIVGYIWSGYLPILQSISLFGIYGLGLLTVVAAALPALYFYTSRKSIHVFCWFGLFILLALAGWGSWRLSVADATPTGQKIRVIQPNIKQELKWDAKSREANFQILLDMTVRAADKTPVVIVWPETASTFYLAEDVEHRRAITDTLPAGSYLLTGVIRRYIGGDEKLHYGNSMMVLDRSGRIAATYDKYHLVPFGEYIPLRRLLHVRTLVNMGVDFTAGPGRRTLHLDNMPSFSPLICYEAIFPGEVVSADERPQLLINITNDGWYGRTAGPYQHFASARARAIEEGLPLVRSANTGISAVVDSYGRIVAQISLGQAGFIDADIPQSIAPTFYARQGDLLVWIIFGLLSVVASLFNIPQRTILRK